MTWLFRCAFEYEADDDDANSAMETSRMIEAALKQLPRVKVNEHILTRLSPIAERGNTEETT